MRQRLTGTAALATASVTVLAAPVSHGSPNSAWYWEWSDGSRTKTRVIAEAWAAPVDSVPDLTVASAPAAPGRLVELLLRHEGRWIVEDSARTDRMGVARLALNPYCGNGGWCNSTVDYRLRVDGITASLRVRFTPSESSAGQ